MADKTMASLERQDDPRPGDGVDDTIPISMDKRVDLALSLVVAATGVLICYLASQFRLGSFPDPVTSRGLPYFTGGFMILAGLVNAARRLLTWSSMPGSFVAAEGKLDDPAHASSSARPFAVIGLALGWVLLLRPLGFLIVTPVMLAGMLWLMGARSPAKLFGFSFGLTLVVWVVFSQVLRIIFPLGPLTSLARAWGLTP